MHATEEVRVMNPQQIDQGVLHLSPAEVVGMLNDTLPPDELTRIEAHLQSCGECRLAIDSHKGGSTTGTEKHHAATLDAPSPVGAAAPSSLTINSLSEMLARSGLMTDDELVSFIADS